MEHNVKVMHLFKITVGGVRYLIATNKKSYADAEKIFRIKKDDRSYPIDKIEYIQEVTVEECALHA